MARWTLLAVVCLAPGLVGIDGCAPPPPTFWQVRGFNQTVFNVLPNADGSMWVVGPFDTHDDVARGSLSLVNADGSPSEAFAGGAGFGAPNSIGALAHAPDGSGDVYVGGGFVTYDGAAANRIVRLNADGSRDTTFDIGTGFGDPGTTPVFPQVFTILPATDGSGDVFIGGRFSVYNGAPANRLVRLNPDGSVDPSLNVGAGIPADFSNHVSRLVFATDGSGDLLVSGFFASYQGEGANGLLRLNVDGSADAALATLSGFDLPVTALAPALDGSGDVYAAGEFSRHDGAGSRRIARLNENGALDAAFNAGTGFDAFIWDVAAARDGSGDVYVGGNFTTYNGSPVTRCARLNADGTLDAGFSTGSGFDQSVTVIAAARDGSGDVYVGGSFVTYDGVPSSRIARLNADGSIDTAFNAGTGFSGTVRALAIPLNSTGDIYVAGDFTTYNGAAANRIARLNADGTVDAAFAAGSGFDQSPWTLAMAGSDVYVGGDFTSYNGAPVARLVRLNSDGSVDGAFNAGATFGGRVTAVAVTPTGKVYVGADIFRRLNSNGSVDAGFDAGTGFVLRFNFPGVPHNHVIADVALATDGSGDVIVGGNFQIYDHRMVDWRARLTPDGAIR